MEIRVSGNRVMRGLGVLCYAQTKLRKDYMKYIWYVFGKLKIYHMVGHTVFVALVFLV